MKPIIIYPKNKDNNVTLIKEEFEKYLEQAYDSGYKDGFSAGLSVNYTPISITPEKPFIT